MVGGYWNKLDFHGHFQLNVACSLRSKRFQSSYCAKVRVEAKKTNLARKRLLRRLCCLCFLPFPLASLTESYLFLYCLKDLFTLYRVADKFVLDRQDGGCRKR